MRVHTCIWGYICIYLYKHKNALKQIVIKITLNIQKKKKEKKKKRNETKIGTKQTKMPGPTTYSAVSNSSTANIKSAVSSPSSIAVKQTATPAQLARQKRNETTIPYSDACIRYNDFLLDYCQTSMSALSGCAAGIIGLTGLYGFVFYFICSLFLSFVILAYMGPNASKYFISKNTIITGTLWSGIQTYLLFWTFLFGMVHVYQKDET